jgi:hypothetical protein
MNFRKGAPRRYALLSSVSIFTAGRAIRFNLFGEIILTAKHCFKKRAAYFCISPKSISASIPCARKEAF